MNPNIVIYKVLEENLPLTGVDGGFYYTEKENLYIVNASGALIKQTDVKLVTSLPSVGIVNKLYVLTTGPSFNYYDGEIWHTITNSTNGTVTSVESANEDITVTTSDSTPVLTINTGLLAGQIIKLDDAGQLTVDILVNGTINKAYTTEEQVKLTAVSEGANKTEVSTINGNVLVDDEEVIVYTAPDLTIASDVVLGAVKQGNNVSIDEDGTLNVNISGAGHTLKDEGIALTPRINLNFKGKGIVATDDEATNSTIITVDAAVIDDEAILGDFDHTYSVNEIRKLNNELLADLGDITQFNTNNKSSAVAAVNEVISSITTSTSASGMTYDNTETGISATNAQAAIDQLFQFANNFKNSLAGIIGSPSTTTETFAQLTSDIQSYKTILATTLTAKGIDTVSSESLNSMVAKVDQVVGNALQSQVKLNVSAPYTKVITFTNPINLVNLCSSILTYTAGVQGVVNYLCNFDNSDATSFIAKDGISFGNGTMKIDTKTTTNNCTDTGALGDGNLWVSPVLDSTSFNTIDLIVYTDADIPTFTITGTPLPGVTVANSDIDLSGIYELTGLTWAANVSGTGIALLVFSNDRGSTWHGFDGTDFKSLSIADPADVKAKGTTLANANAMTMEQLEAFRNNSTSMRFGYYLEIGNISDTANTDSIQIKVSMPGYNTITPSTDYTITLSEDGTTLTYVFSNSGTYVINYVDNNNS